VLQIDDAEKVLSQKLFECARSPELPVKNFIQNQKSYHSLLLDECQKPPTQFVIQQFPLLSGTIATASFPNLLNAEDLLN
jgi:hypothetical protein